MTGGGERELRAALSESRRLFLSVGFFSVFVNVLMLTGPLFMLQVYDRVLTSRSEATLVTLVAITAFLFLMMGVLDYARGRVLARAGARLQARLDARVLRAMLARAVSPAERARPATGLRDLEAMQRFASGTGPFAFFDAPWTPVFLGVLFMFHWMLGLLAVFSGVLLLVLALLNQARTGRLQQELGEAAARSAHFVEQMRAGSETVQGLGMQDAVVAQSGALRGALLDRTLAASDRSGFFGVTTKTLRLFLQSMMLGLGAWLAIQGLVSFGVIIAASILLGRALAPIDQAVGQWPLLQRVLAARRSLARLLEETPPDAPRTALPVPRALLEVQGLTVAAPGARVAAVRGAAFRLEPGRAAGIAGASASGKSTLARALAGVYRPLAGSVRLDGAELDQYGADLGHHVGYLPQEVVLFEGTVARNIARFAPDAKDEDVVEAAKRTGAHEMILKLPGGYDFQVSAGGAALSGGQRQRIALARAFYGSPVVVGMDEPDSNLDAEGTMALAGAIEGHKKRGGAAVVVAHRHGAFAQCDTVYVMEAGRPVPAGRRKAPVRQLQAGAAEGEAPERTSPAADGRAAAAPAAGAAGEAPGDARVVRIPTGDAAPGAQRAGRAPHKAAA
ncbi:MAG: type I secretion system permease/ATPase, partial [Alphaproteobacteria bacterium]|nr:type I secretion system permease/ATPase [Alphaproteobacteria bacterium]